MFGITDKEDLQKNIYIYWCGLIKAKPSIITFKAQVKKIYQLGTRIAQFNHKWLIHKKIGQVYQGRNMT